MSMAASTRISKVRENMMDKLQIVKTKDERLHICTPKEIAEYVVET
uniref:Uncharacterized protein n=1 Tax=Ditylenchus dipsaci TaxID=166011 RepID=A0A915DX44_9BILA